MTAIIDGRSVTVELRVAKLSGYLLAKIHAAYERILRKDWYDIAYVLIHNDEGGPAAAGTLVRERFSANLVGQTRQPWPSCQRISMMRQRKVPWPM